MTDFTTLDQKITQLNQRLKAAQMGLQIERRGQKLNLRGTLPPRPGSDRLKPHQQRLSLGIPATPAGLKQAEQEVKIIAAQLLQNHFDWRNYHHRLGRIDRLELADKITAFGDYFFAQPQRQSRPASTKTTWESAYEPYLRQLTAIANTHPNLSLTEAIYATINATDVNARSRQTCCTAMAAFAEFLNLPLPLDLKTLTGGYDRSQATPRQLPSDELILATWEQIPNPAWRFVYGLMATYGLRNHEVFFCDLSSLQHTPEATVRVLATTKTGEHEVWPFYPAWVETFHLKEGHLPAIQTDLAHTTLQRIGQRVTAQFRRYGVPFSPYDLRHAWAVRTIHFGLPDTVAAKMMGHSVAIHNRTYHQWLTRRDQQQAVAAALQRMYRMPPSDAMHANQPPKGLD